eukprot:13587781-Alexandrium_andersonii.AAC.1
MVRTTDSECGCQVFVHGSACCTWRTPLEGTIAPGFRPSMLCAPAHVPVSYTHLTLPTICSV